MGLTCLDKLRWDLFKPGERVLAAVSGGPDSLSLLHALWTEGAAQGVGGVEAAHLDHGLRGDESAAEAQWVADWCAERGIVCHVGRADVKALASARKLSTQEAARLARYAFLEETAAAVGAEVIATGHTRDDQTETVLGNILRGTGSTGLRGIPERRGKFVRPLLDVSRVEIEAYCMAHGLTPRRDPSNFSQDHYTRNRIRLELLPQLRRDFNPNVDAALRRLAEIAGRDSDYLAVQAAAALTEMTQTRDAFQWELDRAALAVLHPALLRYVLRQAIATLRGTAEGITYEHLEMVCQAIGREPHTVFSLTFPHPLCRVHISAHTVVLTLATGDVAVGALSIPLPVPGEAMLDEIGWRITAGWEETPDAVALDACFDADTVDLSSLVLRNWRSGDRIDPLGMGGQHKKVSDIFTDAKVPRSRRHRVPIVADSGGILWIVGHTVAERAKITPGASRRLYLRAGQETSPSPSFRGEEDQEGRNL